MQSCFTGLCFAVSFCFFFVLVCFVPLALVLSEGWFILLFIQVSFVCLLLCDLCPLFWWTNESVHSTCSLCLTLVVYVFPVTRSLASSLSSLSLHSMLGLRVMLVWVSGYVSIVIKPSPAIQRGHNRVRKSEEREKRIPRTAEDGWMSTVSPLLSSLFLYFVDICAHGWLASLFPPAQTDCRLPLWPNCIFLSLSLTHTQCTHEKWCRSCSCLRWSSHPLLLSSPPAPPPPPYAQMIPRTLVIHVCVCVCVSLNSSLIKPLQLTYTSNANLIRVESIAPWAV